jgi:hypothetical protein
MRVQITDDPFAHVYAGKSLWTRSAWPARWVSHPEPGAAPFVVAYRRSFKLAEPVTLRLHVTADERYHLWLDGSLIGRGPERGDADHWYYETYEVPLSAGRHTLVARVWSLGPGERSQMAGEGGGGAGGQVAAAYAQLSVYHGLLVACDEALLPLVATGASAWEAKVLSGYAFSPPGLAWGTGARASVDGSLFAWNFHRGDGDGWAPVVDRHAGVVEGRMEAGPSHLIRPATLPPMLDRYVRAARVRHVEAHFMDTPGRRLRGNEPGAPARPTVDLSRVALDGANNLPDELREIQERLSNRQPLRFGPYIARRILLDLENYYCAYPTLVTGGGRGGVVGLRWAESLFESPNPAEMRKGDRNEIAGKYFIGVGESFHPDGGIGREFDTLWWEAGRYLELFVQTAGEPLEVNLILRETRYPLEMASTFEASDERLAGVAPILLRGLQMCAHETYVDCPYYEQLMYVGDTRLEALATYAVCGDDRLAKKAIALFDGSRLAGGLAGLTQSRYPCRVRQVIGPFSLWWVAMVHDFAMWREDPAFLRSMMPGVRSVIDAYAGFRGAGGLVRGPALGWNFVDWVPAWKNGVPADADFGASGIVNWHFAYTLRLAAELERGFGEPELAARCDRLAREVAGAADAAFWEPARGLFADDAAKRHFSEHAQCMAILSGALDDDRAAQVGRALLTQGDLERATIYFTHYLFEACRVLAGRGVTLARDPVGHLFERLALWFDLPKRGFVTTFESPEPTRSDCHGWGAHPLFHYFATILGVRPAGFGMKSLEIAPNLGPLEWVKGALPHPAGGRIEVELRRTGEGLTGAIVLPEGIVGELVIGGRRAALRGGRNVLEAR